MSTRYVYAIKDVGFKETTQSFSQRVVQSQNNWPGYVCQAYEVAIDKTSGLAKYSPVGNSINLPGVKYRYSTSQYPYIILNRFQVNSYGQTVLAASELLTAPSGYYWECSVSSSGSYNTATVKCVTSNSDSASSVNLSSTTATPGKGTGVYGYQSSAAKNLSEGLFYDGTVAKWREYITSDSIDPSYVGFSSTPLTPGQSVSILVSPRNSSYGTISYKFQYSTNGGSSWTDIGDFTTSTSKSVTIPSSATQYKARVQAKDNIGFTSTTYVESSNMSVQRPVTKYTISLSVSPAGAGKVSGAGSYESGTYATVTATPAEGFEFVKWVSGNTTVSTSASYRFSVTSSRTLTAYFEEKIRAYGTADGAHHSIEKAYAISDGVVWEISRGYATADGVWRKLF